MLITKPQTHTLEDIHWKRVWNDMWKLVNRNISFGQQVDSGDQNIDGKMIEIANTGAANTEVAITHNLGRVPNFIDFKYKNATADWFDSGTAWTKNKVFVKFSAPNLHVRLFIH